MSRLVPIVLGVGAIAVLLTFGQRARASDPTIGEPDTGGQAQLRTAMERLQLPADWQAYLGATAYGESRFNSRVALGPNNHPGRPPWAKESKASTRLQNGEARASAKAYERNAERFAGSPYPPARYQFGSGGMFAFLPPNALAVFRGSDLINLDPWMVFDTETSLVMALGYSRGLMRWPQWRNSPQTWLTLRVGHALPGAMDKPNGETYARIRRKFGRHLEAIGVDPGFMDRRVPILDYPSSAELWRELKEGAVG